MSNKKEILILVETFVGGVGTVARNLAESFSRRGYDVFIIPTLQPKKEADKLLNGWPSKNTINIYYIKDDIRKYNKFFQKIIMFISKVIIRIFENKKGKLYKRALIQKRYAQNYRKSLLISEFLKKHKNIPIIALAHNPSMLVLPILKREKTKNKIIISERSSQDEITGRTMDAFITELYPEADNIVFQSPDVREWYKETYNIDGTVIFNPIKENLPQPYYGKRQKKIVNFCRINPQKNLSLLLKAFSMFVDKHPEYELYIYGDVDESLKEYGQKIQDEVSVMSCKDKIHILPSSQNVHELVKDFEMFVSSSDYEGMSNSMIEAMAIGLPVICTDCPAGGARAVIRNYENGLLTPIKDETSLSNAMIEIAQNPELAKKLSQNGSKIREAQSSDFIAGKWLELLGLD